MWFSAGIWSSASQCVARQSCCYQNRKKKPAAVKTKIVYQRAVSTVIFFFFWFCEKKRNRAFAKNREREKTPSTEWKKKDGQSRGARTCMYDFIRPKMETYLFPAKWRWPEIRVFFSFDAAFFSLFFNFVLELAVFLLPSLSYRTRERARQRNTRKKKTPKMYKEFKWFKVFRGAGFGCAHERMEQRLENLLMKFFVSSFGWGNDDDDGENEKNKHRAAISRP